MSRACSGRAGCRCARRHHDPVLQTQTERRQFQQIIANLSGGVFLVDPGDRRRVFGAQSSHMRPVKLGCVDGILSFDAQWRGNRIGEVGLYPTVARERIGTAGNDKVSQDLVSVHGQQLVNFTDTFRGLWDCGATGCATTCAARPPPSTRRAATRRGACRHWSRARARKSGWRYQPRDGLTMTAALWQLQLDSELVYVGDAGTTEPGRASKRRGIETKLRWQVDPHWRVEADAALSRARLRGMAPDGEGNSIDNAIERVIGARVVWQQGPWTSSLRLRYMGPRALDTQDLVRSRSLTVLNFGNHVRGQPAPDAWTPGVQPDRQEGQRHRILLRLVLGAGGGQRCMRIGYRRPPCPSDGTAQRAGLGAVELPVRVSIGGAANGCSTSLPL